jgi:ribonuclease HII
MEFANLPDAELTPGKLFKIFEKVKNFPKKCRGREAELPVGQYFTLGACKRYGKSSEESCISEETKKRTILVDLVTRFGRKYLGAEFKFTSIVVNKNAPAKMHSDDNAPQHKLVGGIALVDENSPRWQSSEASPAGDLFLCDQDNISSFFRGPEAVQNPIKRFGTTLPVAIPGRVVRLKNSFQEFDGSIEHCTIQHREWVAGGGSGSASSNSSNSIALSSPSSSDGNASVPSSVSHSRYFLGFYVLKHAPKFRKKIRSQLKKLGFQIPHFDSYDAELDDDHVENHINGTDVNQSVNAQGSSTNSDAENNSNPNRQDSEEDVRQDYVVCEEIALADHERVSEIRREYAEATAGDESESESEESSSTEDSDDESIDSSGLDSSGLDSSGSSDLNNGFTSIASVTGSSGSGGGTSTTGSTDSEKWKPTEAWNKLPPSLPLPRRSKKGENSTKVVCAISVSGYGTIAGPLTAGAVALQPGRQLCKSLKKGVCDPRKLSPKQRSEVFQSLTSAGVVFEHVMLSNEEVDRLGYKGAWNSAIRRCYARLSEQIVVEKILVNGSEQQVPKDWRGNMLGGSGGDSNTKRTTTGSERDINETATGNVTVIATASTSHNEVSVNYANVDGDGAAGTSSDNASMHASTTPSANVGTAGLRADIEVTAIKNGHTSEFLLAAAKIMAKVTHDYELHKMHDEFPEYDFASHEGYAGAQHKKLLLEHGPCKYHRMIAKPVIAGKEAMAAKTGKSKSQNNNNNNFPKKKVKTGATVTSKKLKPKASANRRNIQKTKKSGTKIRKNAVGGKREAGQKLIGKKVAGRKVGGIPIRKNVLGKKAAGKTNVGKMHGRALKARASNKGKGLQKQGSKKCAKKSGTKAGKT